MLSTRDCKFVCLELGSTKLLGRIASIMSDDQQHGGACVVMRSVLPMEATFSMHAPGLTIGRRGSARTAAAAEETQLARAPQQDAPERLRRAETVLHHRTGSIF